MPGARADLAHHLDVVRGPHAQPLGLEQLVLPLQLRQPVLQLQLDARDRPLHALRAGDVVGGREDVHLLLGVDDVARQRVQRGDRLDLVAEELDPDGQLLVHRDDLDGVPAHPERAARERHVVAGVLHGDELAQQLVAVHLVAHRQRHHPVDVLLRRAQAVDAADRGDDDDVPAGEQRAGGRVPQPLDLVVDRRVLLDVGVRLRDVRLGLVVVVVRDEVLDRVVGQQLPELRGQLRRERLVGRHHERRALHLLDEPGRRRRLARPGGAEQDDVLLPRLDPRRQLLDRLRLVTGRRVLGDHLEGRDGPLEIGDRTHATTVRGTTDTRVGGAVRRGCRRTPARPWWSTSAARSRACSAVGGLVDAHRRLAGTDLRGGPGQVHEPAAHLRAGGEQVLERVEGRVADVQPGGVRHLDRDADLADGGGARLDGERGEERGGRPGDDGDVDRCGPVHVRDAGVDHVDRHPFDADLASSGPPRRRTRRGRARPRRSPSAAAGARPGTTRGARARPAPPGRTSAPRARSPRATRR